jgi:hypothetical protein
VLTFIWRWVFRHEQLGVVRTFCRHCGGEFPHTVFKDTKVFLALSTFPIPIQVRYSLQCSSCVEQVGASPYPIGADVARELLATAPPK